MGHKKPSPFAVLHQQLAKSVATQTASAEPWLRRVEEVNRRADFLAREPAKLAADPVGDPGPDYPRLHPATPESPRVFTAYRWSHDNTVEIRAGEAPRAEAVSEMFPEAEPGKRGVPKLAPPQPLPDPPHWPKLRPY